MKAKNPLDSIAENLRNTVINPNRPKYREKRVYDRIECQGDVAFFNSYNNIIAIGELKRISKRGACFEVHMIDSKLENIVYFEFSNTAGFNLTPIRVELRISQKLGSKTFAGLNSRKLIMLFSKELRLLLIHSVEPTPLDQNVAKLHVNNLTNK